MRTVAAVLIGALLAVGLQAPASAQTRLTVAAGGAIPFGNLGDRTDPSPRAVLALELQPMNALGKVSPVSLLGYVAYTDLSLTSELEKTLLANGENTEPYILEVGAGMRVYSRVAPFFLGAGAAYARYLPGGSAGDRNGVDVHGGLGFLVPTRFVMLEAEASGHAVLLKDDDLQFLAVTLGVALPF